LISGRIQAVNRFQGLAALLLLTPFYAIPGSAETLKLLVSVQQQNIVAPAPVRATLHFHNSSRQTLWLYRPVRRKRAAAPSDSTAPGTGGQVPGQTSSGPTLEVRLVAINPSGSDKQEAAGSGYAIAPDALPFPRLVRLAPGKDYDEKVDLQVEPAQSKTSGDAQPVWGPYRFSVSYSADYANAEILARDIDAHLWRGQVSSNAVTLDLSPPAARGSIAGTVFDSLGRPYSGALVTLSNDDQSAIHQLDSGLDGRFSFTHLPLGRYWVTVRQPGSIHDTSVFRHLDVSQDDSPATVEIMMLPVESNRADRLLHKPVLFHIIDGKGHPLAKVKLDILYSTGGVLEDLKVQTGGDGFAEVRLIPGSNLVTLRRPGCKDEDRRADVAPGPGVDGFQYSYECSRK